MAESVLDLRAAEKRLQRRSEQRSLSDHYDAADMQEEDDVRMIFAHCRALRAALKDAEYWMGFRPDSQERLDLLMAARKRVTTVLAQATDERDPG